MLKKLDKLIMESELTIYNTPNSMNMRISKNRKRMLQEFKEKLLAVGKYEYLKKLFIKIKNLDELNLTEEQIDLLSNNVLKFLDDEFDKHYVSHTGPVGIIASKMEEGEDVLNILETFNGEKAKHLNIPFRKRLSGVLNETLKNNKIKNGDVIIIKQNNKVSLYKLPHMKNDKPLKTSSNNDLENYINWLKNDFILRNNYNLYGEFEF